MCYLRQNSPALRRGRFLFGQRLPEMTGMFVVGFDDPCATDAATLRKFTYGNEHVSNIKKFLITSLTFRRYMLRIVSVGIVNLVFRRWWMSQNLR